MKSIGLENPDTIRNRQRQCFVPPD